MDRCWRFRVPGQARLANMICLANNPLYLPHEIQGREVVAHRADATRHLQQHRLVGTLKKLGDTLRPHARWQKLPSGRSCLAAEPAPQEIPTKPGDDASFSFLRPWRSR